MAGLSAPQRTSNLLLGHARRLICPFDEVLENVRKSASLFDIGCGTGAFLLMAVEQRGCRRIGGYEIRENLARNAKKFLRSRLESGIQIEITCSKEVPSTISSYDHVSMVDVLHHIPKEQQSAFFQQLGSQMASRSRLIIKDIDGASPFVWFNRLHDLIVSGGGFQEVPKADVVRALELNQFKILDERIRRKLWYPHFWILGEKE